MMSLEMTGAKNIFEAAVRKILAGHTFLSIGMLFFDEVTFPKAITGKETLFEATVRKVLSWRTILSIGRLFPTN